MRSRGRPRTEAERTRDKAYYKAHREKIKNRSKSWRESHKHDPEYKVKRKQKNAAWNRLRNYGVTEEAYNRMLAEQNGRCLICGSDLDLCIDHSHATGNVRAIVCRRCNKVLGFSGDQPELLRRAAEYLENQAWVSSQS